MSDDALDAGDFGQWVVMIRDAIRNGGNVSVPCDGCTACCRSAQFIDISPDETETLRRIPPAVLSPAPGRPGHLVLGYDQYGRCPMLVDDRCSIYADRPQACRTYDCRVFAATGLAFDEPGSNPVARQAVRWRFTYASPGDKDRHEELQTRAQSVAGGASNSLDAALRTLDL